MGNTQAQNCSDVLPAVNNYIRDLPEKELAGICICAVMATFNLLLYIEELYRLSQRSRDVELQEGMHPAWLLAIFPVISITAVMTLFIPRSLELNKLVASLFLSIAIIRFVDLMMGYLGGQEKCLETLSHEKLSLRSPPLCCICPCPEIMLSRRNMRLIYYMVSQVAISRPILLYALGIIMADDRAALTSYTGAEAVYSTIQYIITVSTITSMWGLVMFFRTLKKHLKPHGIVGKFICMQLSILFLNVQGTILNTVQNFGWLPCKPGLLETNSRSQNIQNVLLVGEMFLLGILARIFYFRRPVQRSDLDQLAANDNTLDTDSEEKKLIDDKNGHQYGSSNLLENDTKNEVNDIT